MKTHENYPQEVDAVLELALREDIGSGDVTTGSIVPEDAVLNRRSACEGNRRGFRTGTFRRRFPET